MKMLSRVLAFFLIIAVVGCSQKSKEEIFWNWFEENSTVYFDNADNMNPKSELANTLTQKLKSVHPDLVWEIGELENIKKKELTISADGLKEVFPAVLELTEAAPEIPKWNIIAFRQRIPGDDLGIQMEDFSISYKDIYFNHVQENNLIGLELYIKNYTEKGYQQNAIFILMDALLGEYDTETKIDWIEWHGLEEGDTTNLLPFRELRDIVDQL
ncbi:hypothetical protein [Ulvibacterium sp.]|uniref:hypothetical protein n=1 Tax=Ulvibacterium sp. TaxID=2665914 RepID=UPI002626F116|nr:hypothetical protein [Ulvibacterium sp.]